MDAHTVIRSQYLAALAMLEQAVTRCPQALWDDPQDRNRFWHVAYHVLFYTHLYVQPSEADFHPWVGHRPGLNRLETVSDEGLASSQVLDYLQVVREEVQRQTATLVLEAPSGFYWIPFNKLELQFYNMRHIQQHTGELMERLGARAGIDIDWVGSEAG